MSVTPNLTYRFNIVPIKIPAGYFVDAIKLTLNFIWKAKDQNSQQSIEGKNTFGGWMLLKFKTYYSRVNHQDSALLAKEETSRLMDQVKDPKSKPS